MKLSTNDYAARIRAKPSTVRRWIHEGMPVHHAGRRVLIDSDAADAWVAARHADTIAINRASVVYVARAANGLIKIGFTSNTERRTRELEREAGCPVKVLATFPGDAKLESMLHTRFASERAHGEWFKPHGDVESFATALEAAA